MAKVFSLLVSMKTMGFLLLVFATAIGVATFIENDYGTDAAKALVYNARWFEFLLYLLALNLISNLFIQRLYRRGKWPMLLLHVAFLLILLGAAVTRYVGFEGVMLIREGESKNYILSRETYLMFEAYGGGQKLEFAQPVLFSPLVDNHVEQQFELGGKEVTFELAEYIPRAFKALEDSPDGRKMLSVVTAVDGGQGRDTHLVEEGEHKIVGNYLLSFEKKMDAPREILLFDDQGELKIQTNQKIEVFEMDSGQSETLEPDVAHPFLPRRLYTIDSVRLVYQDYRPSAKVTYQSASKQSGQGLPDLLRLKVTVGETSEMLEIRGQQGVVPRLANVQLGGYTLAAGYGARKVPVPFSVHLRDFELERYPGSMSPSSYASEVSVLNESGEKLYDYRIYMNHILEHEGYRFYQSSYDPDEGGTVLSVNHDYWGTLITYAGYLMLAIGMFLALASPHGRVRKLLGKVDKLQAVPVVACLLLAGLMTGSLHAEEKQPDAAIVAMAQTISGVTPEHAKEFGTLVVQDRGGRMKPIDTLASEVLMKISRAGTMYGMDANRVLLGMMVRPDAWQQMRIIRVNHPEVRELLEMELGQKWAAFSDFFVTDGEKRYKLAEHIEEASRKRPALQNKFDKEVIKVDERLNICYMVFTGSLFRILPKPNDENHQWFAPQEAMEQFPEQERYRVRELMFSYFRGLDKGIDEGDWSEADKGLQAIKEYQTFYGATILPSESELQVELLYNELQIFKRLFPLYLISGLLLLFIAVAHIIKPKFNLNKIARLFIGIMAIGFALHTAGLGLRWYISGHAPWSDGYESMIYIGWATVLAGFLFVRNTPIALAATGILAGVILFSAHLSWMDPQITNIVPVLNSYWLIIHVSMITASYGFLGLGALLGFIVLLLMILKRPNTQPQADKSIMELTYVNEMALLVGLVLLTIGNFLGGVWANESWGRYWGWDPKETWALVTILVYAFVLHMRFIPGLRGVYTFNVASVIALASVMMTYFGVNFYLSGLHSYAKGDPVPIPTFVYVSVIVVALVILAALRGRQVTIRTDQNS